MRGHGFEIGRELTIICRVRVLARVPLPGFRKQATHR